MDTTAEMGQRLPDMTDEDIQKAKDTVAVMAPLASTSVQTSHDNRGAWFLTLAGHHVSDSSSHYSSGNRHAPRLIALDLDVVITSEREWACYPSVPGIGIAQLARSQGVDAVLVTP